MPDTKKIARRFLKYDESLGLVLGYAIVCRENGEPYFDLQGDHITETAMLKAATDFMLNSRLAGEMHTEDADGETIPVGKVVHSWPETADTFRAFNLAPTSSELAALAVEHDVPVEKVALIAKAVNRPKTTGLKIAIKPNDGTLARVRSGKLAGFSIGGERDIGKDEDVNDG